MIAQISPDAWITIGVTAGLQLLGLAFYFGVSWRTQKEHGRRLDSHDARFDKVEAEVQQHEGEIAFIRGKMNGRADSAGHGF